MAGLTQTWDGRGVLVVQGNLLDPTSAPVTNQAWYFLDGRVPFTVSVDGTFTGTVTVLGSNLIAAPPATDSTGHSQLGVFTIADSLNFDKPYQWVKAVASPLTAGTVSVSLLAKERARAGRP